jgi:hypothetical protein
MAHVRIPNRTMDTAAPHPRANIPPSRGSGLRRLLAAPVAAAERRPLVTFAAVGLACAIIYLTGVLLVPSRSGRVINGDAIQYFAYLQSAVVDGDLDFTNDYRQLFRNSTPETNVWLRSVTPVGRPINMMSVGPALLWSPFYLAARAVMGTPEPGTRAESALQSSVGLAGIVYATLGAWFTFFACRLLYSPRAAFWATLLVWLAGPAIYYSLVSPAYSHATSMCVVAAFAWAWLATRDRFGTRHALLLGALGGLVALVRWQDAIVLLLPAGDAAWAAWRGERRLRTAFLQLILMGISSTVAFAPQLAAWQAIYGTPVLVPQGAGFMRWTEPAIGSVLFSLRHGLFSWTPALLVASCGLPLLIRRHARAGWLVLLVLALTVYVNASVIDWWAGAAFGARRFIGVGVFFALGMSAILDAPWVDARRLAARWLIVAAIAYNLLFVLQYQLFMRGMRDLVPYPSTLQQVFVDRLWLPVQLLMRWVAGP